MLDVLLRRGRVVDGSGTPSFIADVAVKEGRIVEVGDFPQAAARKTVEASGKVICPGFIDIHSHNDLYIIRDDFRDLFRPFLRQGVTTCVAGNCGWSVAPWPRVRGKLMSSTLRSMGVGVGFQPEWETQAEWHDWLRGRGLPLNMVPLAAHGPIRMAVMGGEARFCRDDELLSMEVILRECMEAGCRGFSTGLTYFPGMFAHTREIVGLARVAAGYGGRYVTHVRGHCGTYDRAVGEALEISRRSGAPLQLSHVYAVPWLGPMATVLYGLVGAVEALNRLVTLPPLPNPALRKALALVDRALHEGMDVGMDHVPYVMGNATATQLFPPWANRGGTEGLLRRLADPRERDLIRRDIQSVRPTWPPWAEGGWSDNYIKAVGWRMLHILSVGSERNRHLQGKRVWEMAKREGKDPLDWLADLMLEEDGRVTYLFGVPPRPWSERAFAAAYTHPALSVGADVVFPEVGVPPQSAFGCFVRFIEHHAGRLGLYSLEEAVRRCTGLSASRFGLKDRGLIEKGAAADLVVLDPLRLKDNSRFDDPARCPEGIDLVMVNGRVVVEGDVCFEDITAGQLLTS